MIGDMTAQSNPSIFVKPFEERRIEGLHSIEIRQELCPVTFVLQNKYFTHAAFILQKSLQYTCCSLFACSMSAPLATQFGVLSLPHCGCRGYCLYTCECEWVSERQRVCLCEREREQRPRESFVCGVCCVFGSSRGDQICLM